MELNEFQSKMSEFVRYPKAGTNIVYTALALCGEAGEFAENIKKSIRDEGYFMGDSIDKVSKERREKAKAELFDVFFYVACNATELGLTLEDVALFGVDKLTDRKLNGKRLGSG